MFRGVLVTNAFLKTGKFTEHYIWLSEAAKRLGISLEKKTNADFFLPFGEGSGSAPDEGTSLCGVQDIRKYDFILYWDKDLSLGRRISMYAERFSIPVFNSIEAIGLCDDKIATYDRISMWNQMKSDDEQIPIIPTVMAPMTYRNIGYPDTSFVSGVTEYLGLPVVIKECCGSFGMQVYLAKTEKEVLAYTKRLEGIPFLYQKFVENSAGRDVRLQVVGDSVVASMYRFSENGDFRANLSNGGSMKPYAASVEEKALAVRTVKALGLDFAGVDLLFSGNSALSGKEEADLVCEVNSNAHFKNIYTCTGVDTADCIMKYILGKIAAGKEKDDARIYAL